MNKKIGFFICLMILLCVCIAGCGPQSEANVTPYTRYVESHDGVQVAVPEHPKRILSLLPSSITTERPPEEGTIVPVGAN